MVKGSGNAEVWCAVRCQAGRWCPKEGESLVAAGDGAGLPTADCNFARSAPLPTYRLGSRLTAAGRGW